MLIYRRDQSRLMAGWRRTAMARQGGRAGSAPQPGGVRALQRALRYLRFHWPDSLGALLALLLVSAANLATPQLIRQAIDQGVARHQSGAVVASVVGLVVV